MAVSSRRKYSATMPRSSMAFISFRFRLKGLHPYKHPLGQSGYTFSKIIAKNPACFDRKPLNSEPKRTELRRSLHRNGTSWSVWRTERNIWNRAYKPQFRQKRKRSRSPAGPRRLGTATRISASLSRRLFAFFGSTHDQAPKAAKFAVLNPGHAGFPKRVERSEGSNTTPTQNATCFAV